MKCARAVLGPRAETDGGANLLIYLVGAAGFEPTTPSPPDWCANRAAPRPDRNGADYRYAVLVVQPSNPKASSQGGSESDAVGGNLRRICHTFAKIFR